jgi:two-component system phosphate regulon sensor histidine kinase PhoR
MFWRLLVLCASLLVVTLALLGGATARRASAFELTRLENELLARVRLVRDTLRGVQPSGLQDHIDRLVQQQPGEVRLTLIDSDGKVLADTDREAIELENHLNRPEIRDAREKEHGAALRSSRSVRRQLLYVSIRAELPESPVAYVRIAVSPGDVQGFVDNLWADVLIAAGAALLLTVIAAAILANGITKPLREVTRAAERIAAGQYGQKVYTSAGGDMARLAQSFNYMSERLTGQVARLEEDHEQLRAILGGMVEGVVALDAEQRVLFANGRAAELLDFVAPGRSAADSVGRKFWDVVRQRSLLDLVQRCLTRDQPQQEELNLYGRSSRSVLVHAVRLPGAPPRGAVLVIHDTSELRRLERLREEFVANVSHELKTPLTVIKANVETLLDEEDLTESPVRGFLEQIADQSERLHRLILDLLSLARIESGAETFLFQSVNVAEAASGCIERHRHRTEARQQSLEAMPSPAELQAWVDEEALAEILENLVDNAVKYTSPGGSIRVRWWSDNGETCLEVKDNGIGIPQQDLPRIFERFYRVDKARSRELGGTGLGLSIVKHLVQSMRGSIVATSQLGQGTSFIIRLPATGG